MHSTNVIVIAALVAASMPVTALAESPQRTLVNRMIFSRTSSFGELDDVADNRAFFDHPVTQSNLEAVKAVIGEKLFEELNLASARSRSVRDFIEDNRQALQKYPYVLTALARDVTTTDKVPLRLHDDDGGTDGESLQISDPARTISAEDIHSYTQGSKASTRNFRQFLQRNFNLENKPPTQRPDQIEAFSVFNNYASGILRKDIDENGADQGSPGLPDSKDPSKQFDYLQDHFVQDAGTGRNRTVEAAPEPNAPGMFLPSAATLDRIKQLLKINNEVKFAKSEGRSPSFDGVDPAVMKEFMQAAGVTDPSELEGISPDALRTAISQLVAKTVQDEIRNNDYVFEQSSVAHTGGTAPVGDDNAGGSAAYAGAVTPSFVIGNPEAAAELDRQLEAINQPMTEAERARLELDNGGGFQFIGDVGQMRPGAKTGLILGPDLRGGALNLRENPRDN